jgi:hypothetical protein
MCRSRLYCVGVLLCALVATGQTPEAAAQIGKFKKVIGNKAADAGVQSAADGAKNSACIPNRPPVVIESFSLTAAQMEKINAGLDAEIAAAPAAAAEVERQQKALEVQQKAYDKAYADYDKRNGPWNDCARKVEEEDAATSEKMGQAVDPSNKSALGGMTQEDVEKLATRAQAAAQRVADGTGTAEDRKTLADFQQAMAGVQSGAMNAAAAQQASSQFNREGDKRIEAKCGKRPEAPTQPSTSGSAEDIIQQAGAKAAGVPPSTWRQWREEQIGLAMSNTVIKPGNGADAMNQQIQATRQKICAMKKAGVPI